MIGPASISPRGERGIRTRAWYLRSAREPLAGDDPQASSWLYAKPDDRFEANDVRARCEPIAEALERGRTEFENLASAGRTGQALSARRAVDG